MSIQSQPTQSPQLLTERGNSPMLRGDKTLRVMSAKVSTWQRIKDIWSYRELLISLTRKELKVKYKGSALGFLWTLLNPALSLVVYYVAFQLILKNGIPLFAIYLLSGLLVWNLFQGSLAAATGSIVGNAAIVGKVSFPREILPLATVGANVVHFMLQTVVLLGALLVFRHSPDWQLLALLIPGAFTLLVLASAFGILLSAVNVRFRDTQHLLDLVLFAWFWTMPIVAYTFARVASNLDPRGLTWIYLLNPLTPIVLLFQRVLYNDIAPIGANGQPVPILPEEPWTWYVAHCGYSLLFGTVLLFIALKVFSKLEGDFAEEL